MVPMYKGAEKKSYYKFIQPVDAVSKEEVKKYKTFRGDPKYIIPFAERGIIQTPEYEPAPDGVYYAPDGTIFLSIVTPVPNMTAEMMEWYMIWHQLDPLRYALWNPEDHYGEEISEEARKRILNHDLSYRERLWGIDCLVIESMNGEKPMKGLLKFVNPETVGFKNDIYGVDSCLSMFVVNNSLKLGPIEIPIMMTEMLRKGKNGQNEWVVTAWMGHGVKDGKDICRKLPLRNIMAKMPSILVVHSHKEVAHLNKIIKPLFEENKDNWLE